MGWKQKRSRPFFKGKNRECTTQWREALLSGQLIYRSGGRLDEWQALCRQFVDLKEKTSNKYSQDPPIKYGKDLRWKIMDQTVQMYSTRRESETGVSMVSRRGQILLTMGVLPMRLATDLSSGILSCTGINCKRTNLRRSVVQHHEIVHATVQERPRVHVLRRFIGQPVQLRCLIQCRQGQPFRIPIRLATRARQSKNTKKFIQPKNFFRKKNEKFFWKKK